ncbi:MAG: hypothetical protein JNK15_03480 [Planctomycetes bacterium]|nr:hypothetical protein [Planctomycetota bacterium]
MRTPFLFVSVFVTAALLPAQNLRQGLVEADAVVVARQVGKTPHDDDLTLHRLQVVHTVRGAAGATAITVLDWPKLALHQRPTPRQSRLYCLQDASATATRLGLPVANGPYFKMVGWAGANPLVGAEPAADPAVRFATVLAAAEAGASPTDTATTLCAPALGQDPVLRLEATRYLTERPDLRSKLGGLQWSQLLARATGEIDDVAHKTALAELCGEQRLEGVFDTLLVALGPVDDAEFARTVGRIGRALHGEDATERITTRLSRAANQKDKKALLLALGATSTASALDALLRMDKKDAAVEAALREHRSPAAREAVGTKKK